MNNIKNQKGYGGSTEIFLIFACVFGLLVGLSIVFDKLNFKTTALVLRIFLLTIIFIIGLFVLIGVSLDYIDKLSAKTGNNPFEENSILKVYKREILQHRELGETFDQIKAWLVKEHGFKNSRINNLVFSETMQIPIETHKNEIILEDKRVFLEEKRLKGASISELLECLRSDYGFTGTVKDMCAVICVNMNHLRTANR